MNIAKYLDHAVLGPAMTPDEARAAIQLGIDLKVYSICVRGADIEMALEMCRGTDTRVGCVLDFPYGFSGANVKRAAARDYAERGVCEIDMVMNYGYALGGRWDLVEEEVRGVVEEAHARGVGVKVIFETSQWPTQKIADGVEACVRAGADFVKTSTGFNGVGATVEAVKAMLDAAAGRVKVKPSGGIRDYATARMYLDMGVDRLGVGSSGSKVICEGQGTSTEAY